ncbi:acetyltransferase [Ectopseudomonas khazarica]|uniref:Acetyltransferase n=1 Tax=Ectopseudomonas khazarica TaxID=2502979 RepID=A0ABW7M8K8_9GAMM
MGAGGHARVVLDVLRLRGYQLRGVCAPELLAGSQWHGVDVLGDDAVLDELSCDEVWLANGVGLALRGMARRRIQEAYLARGYSWLTLEHPSSLCASDTWLACGVQLMAGAVVQPGCRLETGVVINTRATVDHDCQLGEHVFVGPGAVLCGAVKVDRGAFIGAGAVILPGIHLGEDAIIGAGAVVMRSVEAGCTAVGNPARTVK